MQKNKDQKSPLFSMSIILIGMMGCGKSHIGRLLAQALNLPFHDSDKIVEENQGVSIADIFQSRGEEAFREAEYQAIKGTLNQEPCVLSTGGGAMTFPKTLSLLQGAGVLVWIKSDLDVILSRIKNDDARPLLQTENPQDKLKELLHAREHLYKQADIQVENNSTAEDVIANITQALTNYV